MTWRPEGWETVLVGTRIYKGELLRTTTDAFEAGADAMLEALRARGFLDMGEADELSITGIYPKPIKFIADCHGKLVLIPD